MPDKTYIKFLETMASNSHPTRKYYDLQLLFFNKFYDKFLKVKDNIPRTLKVNSDDFKRNSMWEQYIGERKDDA